MLLKYWETWFPNSNYPPWEVKFTLAVCLCVYAPPRWFNSKESAFSAGATGDSGLFPGSGGCPGGRHGNPLQYSYLKNPMDRGAWPTTVHGVAKNWTRLKWLSTHVCVWRRGGFMGWEFFSLYLFYVFQVIYHFKEGINFYQIKICFLKMKRFVLEV